MIIIDYNGIAIANIMVQKLAIDENIIRHMILNSIRMYRTKFNKEYGEVVICSDAGGNWRKQVFPQYKAARKKTRDKSSVDWDEVFRITSMVREEIRENFPYKVIKIDGCEADDVIGTLVIKKSRVDFNPEKIMIVSSDRDFVQLQRFKNVRQFSPILKKEIVEKNARYFLLNHIIRGDKGDGVPNILSNDDTFVEGFRQTPMSQKKVEDIMEDLEQGELLYAASWYRNYCRNEKLIALSETPPELKQQIINNYEDQNPLENKSKVFHYLVTKRCNQLIESVQEFI